jgi:hypothetical protein
MNYIKPWDRKTKEPEKIFSLFCCYRDEQGLRDFGKLSEAAGIPVEQMANMAEKWNWTVRASEYDVWLINRLGSYTAENIANREQILDMDGILSSISNLLNLINNKINNYSVEIEKLKPDEIIKLINSLLKIIPDIKDAFCINDNNEEFKKDNIAGEISDKINLDEIACGLASDLLERISK